MTNAEAKKRLEVWLKCMVCPEDKQCYDSYLKSTCEYTDYCDETPIDDAIRAGIQALKQTQWIPCSERLPEEETAVLISCEDLYLHRLNPCIGWRNGQYWNTFTANGCKQILYPTAWMPLPEPWKGE